MGKEAKINCPWGKGAEPEIDKMTTGIGVCSSGGCVLRQRSEMVSLARQAVVGKNSGTVIICLEIPKR